MKSFNKINVAYFINLLFTEKKKDDFEWAHDKFEIMLRSPSPTNVINLLYITYLQGIIWAKKVTFIWTPKKKKEKLIVIILYSQQKINK